MLEVPAGWRISGGLARRNALQMWPWVSAVSPDGNSIIGVGDPNLQSHMLPTQMLAMTGFAEGSLYGGGGGTRYILERYRTGTAFAASYGSQVLPRFCQEVRMIGQRDRPDIGRQMSGNWAESTAGEVDFTCRRGGLPMVAMAVSATTLYPMPMVGPGAGLWYPSVLAGFVAPQGLSGVAAGVMGHMLASFETSPAWVARQSQTTMAVSHIATEANHAVSRSIMQSWAQRGAALDRTMDTGSRERLGINYYSDPSTGRQYTVENNHRFYWVDPRGSITGTDTPPPGLVQQLQRVPSGN